MLSQCTVCLLVVKRCRPVEVDLFAVLLFKSDWPGWGGAIMTSPLYDITRDYLCMFMFNIEKKI